MRRAVDPLQPADHRSAVVQGRGHLSAARQVLLRRQQRRHRRFPGPDVQARLHRRARRQRDLAAAVLSRRRGCDDGYDIADYRGVHPDYGTLRDVKRFIHAAHAARHPRHHRTGRSTTPPTSIPGSSARAAPSPARSYRDFYVWSDTDQQIRRHAHHLRRYREVQLDLGSGRRGVLLASLLLATSRI